MSRNIVQISINSILWLYKRGRLLHQDCIFIRRLLPVDSDKMISERYFFAGFLNEIHGWIELVEMKILKGLLIVGIPLLLLASAGLNYVLIKRSVREFKETQNLRLDPISQNRFAQPNADLGAPSGQSPRVVFLGDSRIAQWQNLPDVGNTERVNRGVGGETTAQVLLRADRDVTGIGASLVVIQAGINDLKTLGVVPKRKEEIS